MTVWADVLDGGDFGEFDFLPPVDETLLEAPLGGSPSEGTDVSDVSSEVAPSKKSVHQRPKRVNKLMVELLSLHEDRAELERQLMELESRRKGRLQTLSASALKWRHLARTQLQLKLKVLRENERLRASIAEQSSLQQKLEDVVLKKPRLMMMKMEDDEWRVFKLSANGEKRLVAIHAIADRQLEIIDSEMLLLNLVDTTEDIWDVRAGPSSTTAGAIVGEGIRCTLLHGSLAAVLDATWKALVRGHAQSKSSSVLGVFKSYTIDDDTVYVRKTYHSSDGSFKVNSSVIMKKQVADDGRAFRIVFRTVLDDVAHPSEGDSYVNDEYGWIHVEDVDARAQYKSYIRTNIMLPKHGDKLAELMGALYLEEGQAMATQMKDNPVKLTRLLFDAALRSFEALVHEILDKSNA
ncbi:Aste57867_3180 [Aphanomyces stellatus]|uniref:Aste57867_3180 protein n=1 Tax=Aphanomyces stellatus TaxID=120398 RepID=A0A485KEF2_9STRA|nr:hypothetical protein As57867_003171 [Aphanomyces stellatus]VFT80354.1 Aste57867_3180 [Aphanomyces stellatus]